MRCPQCINAERGTHLVTKNLLERDSAQATPDGNIEHAPLSWFTDIAAGDLHLTAAATTAVDGGISLAAGLCESDIDAQTRDDSPDVGADEIGFPGIFADDFESGNTGAWSHVVP